MTKREMEPSKGTEERCEVNTIQLLWPQSDKSQGMCLTGLYQNQSLNLVAK